MKTTNNKDTFELPKNWCIKVTPENTDILHDWKIKVSNGWYYQKASDHEYIKHNGAGITHQVSLSYDVITFNQFKKYVLKEEPLPKKWALKLLCENIDDVNKYRAQYNKGSFTDPLVIGFEYNYVVFDPDADQNQLLGSNNINGFPEITTDQFKQFFKQQQQEMKKTRTITPKDAKRIITIACPKWEEILADKWGKAIVLDKQITIPEDDYKNMREACTQPQHELFDEIFGKDKEIYPDGTPCLVRNSDLDGWHFRYANGEGKFYANGEKSGCASEWKQYMELDMNNLPVNQ
jgi:hypothetical protein